MPNLNSKLGKFRILAKLHKEKFGIRPIINNKNHPTEKLSQFIDIFLQPFVKNSESYLKDSQNLIQKFDKLKINKNSFKYSCDFESLYTNINTEDAIFSISNYFKNRLSNYSLDFDIIGLNEILRLILYNNVFTFQNLFFKQNNGLAMGIKCGPSIANIYVYIKEINWLLINIDYIPIYKRFIDDIFIVSEFDLLSSNFKNIFENLNLNIIHENEVQFLDLLISNNDYFDNLSFKLYTKKTNTFQYLYQTSNHPNHVFKNIPKSLFIRIRRICTHYIDYLFFSRKLISQLIKRGYNFKDLIKICLIIGKIYRIELILYKSKNDNLAKYNNNKVFKFIINYDFNYISLKNDIYINFDSLKKNFLWLNNYNINTLNSSNFNLNDLFINNFLCSNKVNNFSTKKCQLNNCITCKFVYDKKFIKCNTFRLPMLCNGSCSSSNVIYILLCVKCNVFYIGQTGRQFSRRFREHVNNITRFKFIVQENTELSIHFNKSKHNLYNDLKFLIFKNNLSNLNDRLSSETDLIHIFKSLNLKVINAMIPHLNYIKKLNFY